MTRGEEIIAAFDEASVALDVLQLDHYEEAEIRMVIERIGSRVERFLKSAVFPGSSVGDTFDGMINRLKSAGIDKARRSALHALRDVYNDAKHDPSGPVRLKRAADVVGQARVSVQEIIDKNIGATSAPIEKVISRLLWVSAYDVYVGGVTELYVSLPLPKDVFATHLDVVWVKGLDWDALRVELLATGCFYYGKEHFDAEVYARFDEGDFLNAGVWDGDYRQLIQILSKYEDRPTADRLISNLRRDHMSIAVLSAIALAAVDVVGAATAAMSAHDLTSTILERADKVYAMPGERPWVQNAAQGLTELINQLPFESWAQLSGPFWNLWNPKPLVTVVSPTETEKVRYVIDDANRIVVV